MAGASNRGTCHSTPPNLKKWKEEMETEMAKERRAWGSAAETSRASKQAALRSRTACVAAGKAADQACVCASVAV